MVASIPHGDRLGSRMGRHRKSENGERQKRRRSFLLRFVRDRSGSTLVEFAILAIPFSLLVFAILESCISFAGQEVLANATDDVARQIRTGQLKKSDVTEAKLKQMICDRLQILVGGDCQSSLMVDLRQYGTFAEAAAARFQVVDGDIVLMKDGTRDPKQFTVDPGLAMSKNMLRVFYKWPVMTDFMARSMANLNGGKTLHFATITWQNEPFNDEPAS